jgi:hypothetical protein
MEELVFERLEGSTDEWRAVNHYMVIDGEGTVTLLLYNYEIMDLAAHLEAHPDDLYTVYFEAKLEKMVKDYLPLSEPKYYAALEELFKRLRERVGEEIKKWTGRKPDETGRDDTQESDASAVTDRER